MTQLRAPPARLINWRTTAISKRLIFKDFELGRGVCWSGGKGMEKEAVFVQEAGENQRHRNESASVLATALQHP